jgi:hypothetical protein
MYFVKQPIAVLVVLLCLIVRAEGVSGAPNLNRMSCWAIRDSSDRLCLFRDGRLDEAKVESLWLKGESGHYGNSELRRLSAAGQVVASRRLAPLAKLDTVTFGSSTWLLATEDLSAGMGSYSGPATHVLDLANRQNIANASDVVGREIVLVTTPKTVWKQVSDGFLIAACRPDFQTTKSDAEAFWLTYVRLRLRNGQWFRSDRKIPGYSDFEDVFPADALFPQ